MIQRITRALSLCILLFIPFHGIMAENLVTRDSLNNTTDTLKNGFFHRFYRYFQQSNKVKEEKKFDFSVIGGPHFSSDTKLGLGVVASGLYRIDREDKSISPSNISLYGDITTTGFYLLGIRGNTIFPERSFPWANINMYFFSFPSQYWGIGYDNQRRTRTIIQIIRDLNTSESGIPVQTRPKLVRRGKSHVPKCFRERL